MSKKISQNTYKLTNAKKIIKNCLKTKKNYCNWPHWIQRNLVECMVGKIRC